MPVPKPRSGEEEQAYISRCMGDDAMVSEYKQEQRAAICYSTWREAHGKKAVEDAIKSALSQPMTYADVLKRTAIFLLLLMFIATCSAILANAQQSVGNVSADVQAVIGGGPLVLVLTPPGPLSIACSTPGGTAIQTASTVGGNGNKVKFSLSGSKIVNIDQNTGVISISQPGLPQESCNQLLSYTVSAAQKQ